MGLAVILLVAMAGTAAQDKPEVTSLPPGSPPVIIVPAAPAGLPSRALPTPINPAGWITQADYPAAAIRANAEGVVGYRLDVDARGRPAGCTITESSRNADLDAATCSLLTRRGRFQPALDSRGRPVPGSYVSRVRWDLRGRLRPVPGVGQQIITLTVELDGSVSDCTFSAQGAAATAAADPCKTIRFAPQTGPDAKRRRLRLTTRVEQLDP